MSDQVTCDQHHPTHYGRHERRDSCKSPVEEHRYSLRRVTIKEGWCQDEYGRSARCESIVEDPNGDLFTSRTSTGDHVTVFDIDLSARLRPSKTPGHYHLIVGQVLSWRKYKRLLRAMVRAGLVEREWYDLVKRRGQALLSVEPFT